MQKLQLVSQKNDINMDSQIIKVSRSATRTWRTHFEMKIIAIISMAIIVAAVGEHQFNFSLSYFALIFHFGVSRFLQATKHNICREIEEKRNQNAIPHMHKLIDEDKLKDFVDFNDPETYYPFGLEEDVKEILDNAADIRRQIKTELEDIIIRHYNENDFVEKCEEIIERSPGGKLAVLFKKNAVYVPVARRDGPYSFFALHDDITDDKRTEFLEKIAILTELATDEEKAAMDFDEIIEYIKDGKDCVCRDRRSKSCLDNYVSTVEKRVFATYRKFREVSDQFSSNKNPFPNVSPISDVFQIVLARRHLPHLTKLCKASEHSIVRELVTKCEGLFLPHLPQRSQLSDLSDEAEQKLVDSRKELIERFRAMVKTITSEGQQLNKSCHANIERIQKMIFDEMKTIREIIWNFPSYFPIESDLDEGTVRPIAVLDSIFGKLFAKAIKNLETKQLVEGEKALLPFELIHGDKTLEGLVRKIKETKDSLLESAKKWSKGDAIAHGQLLNNILSLLMKQISFVDSADLTYELQSEDSCKILQQKATFLLRIFRNIHENIFQIIEVAIDKKYLQILDALDEIKSNSMPWFESEDLQKKIGDQPYFKSELKTAFTSAIVDSLNQVSQNGHGKESMLETCATFQRVEIPKIINQMIAELLKQGASVPAEVNTYSLPFKGNVFQANFEMLRAEYLVVVEERAKIAFEGIREHVKEFGNENVFMNAKEQFSWQDMIDEIESRFNESIQKLTRAEDNLNEYVDFRDELDDIVGDTYFELVNVSNLNAFSNVLCLFLIKRDFNFRFGYRLLPAML